MKAILSFCFLMLICLTTTISYSQFQAKPVNSQANKPAVNPQTTTKTTTTTQKLPSPYLLKKDFEERISTVSDRVTAAQNTANSVRRDLEEKVTGVQDLSTRMSSVEEILNSANFKISTTSDSLKLTNTSIEAFRQSTDSQLKKLEEADKKINLVWAGIAASALLALLVFVALNSKIGKLQVALKKQTELATIKLSEELKSDISHSQTKVSRDLSNLKTELQNKAKEDHDGLHSQLQTILAKLEAVEKGKA